MNFRKSKIAPTTIEITTDNGLCIGCGLCSVTCPNQSIEMRWQRGRWVPNVDASTCTDCGQCVDTCPNTPESICEYALAASSIRECFGLQPEAACFVGYDLDPGSRARSASGGIATALLRCLVNKREIDGVIASAPVWAAIGEPHYSLRLFESADELSKARSSHYHPVCYDKVLAEMRGRSGRYALVGLPCVIRGVRRLPPDVRSKIEFTIGLACAHNITGQFLDYLAKRAGIGKGEVFTANQRDKYGVSAAWSFNTCFELTDRVIRQSSLTNGWAQMWRNYFFSPECCLYCPDFYAADADVSVKDAWGKWSEDPLGTSMVIVRNPRIASLLEVMRTEGQVYLEACSAREVFLGQVNEPNFKHVEVLGRLAWKRSIHKEMEKNGYRFPKRTLLLSPVSVRYWQLRFISALSEFCYNHFRCVPVRSIIRLSHAVPASLACARVVTTRIPELRLSHSLLKRITIQRCIETIRNRRSNHV